MSDFAARLGNRAIESLVLAAVLWSTLIHSAFWALTPSVLLGLLGLALCIWAGLRLFAGDASGGRPGGSRASCSNPPLDFQSPWIWAPIVLLCLFAIVQTIPLPVSLVEYLSPKRVALARSLSEALPELEARWITPSVDPRATRRLLPFFLFPLTSFLLGNFLASSRKRVRGLVLFLISLALVESLYGLLEQLTGHNYVLWIPGREDNARGTFLNRNHFAATLCLFLPATIGWLYFRSSDVVADSDRDGILPPTSWDVLGSRQGLWLLAPAVLALGVIQSHSRGGFSSMLFGLALMFGAGMRSRIARTFAALGIILALVIFVYAVNSDYQVVFDRFENLVEAEKEDDRMTTWRNSLGILGDYPVLGIGLGNFANVYRQYDEVSSGASPRRAHNEWLEGLVVFGFPGMSCIALALVVCFVRSFRSIRRAGRDKPWLLGVWCGLLGLVFHSFVEFNFHSPSIVMTATLLMGLLLGFERLNSPGEQTYPDSQNKLRT